MKVGLYSISYLGIWYDGPALSFEAFVKRAKACSYAGIELDGKRPHGNSLDLGRPLPDYAHFIRLMREIGHDGYFCYELCHPVLNEAHEPQGLAFVDEQVQLAQEFMSALPQED